MRNVFTLNEITYLFDSKKICLDMKKKLNVKNVYYNHFFTSFIVECNNPDEVSQFLKSKNISFYINTDITFLSKPNYFIPIGIFLIFIVQMIFNIPYLSIISYLLCYKSIISNLMSLKNSYINDNLILYFFSIMIILNPFVNVVLFLIQLKTIIIYLRKKKTIAYYNNANFSFKPTKTNQNLTIKNADTKNYMEKINGFVQIDKSDYTSEIPINSDDIYIPNQEHSESIKSYFFNSIISIPSYTYQFDKKYYLIFIVILIFTLLFNILFKINVLLFINIITIVFWIIIDNHNFNYYLENIKRNFDFFKKGIIFSNTEILNTINNSNNFLFDKDGIITSSTPEVKDVYIKNGVNTSDFYHIAYMLVKRKNDTISNPIKKYLKNINLNTLDSTSIKNITKKRVDFYIKNQFGVMEDIEKLNIDLSILKPSILNFRKQGKRSIVFVENNTAIGIITTQDILKKDVINTVDLLKQKNINCVLVDYNDLDIIKHYAKKLNISDYYKYEIENKKHFVNNLNDEFVFITTNPINTNKIQIIISKEINIKIDKNIVWINNEDIKNLITLINKKAAN